MAVSTGERPPVDARSIIAVLALGARGGDTVTIVGALDAAPADA